MEMKEKLADLRKKKGLTQLELAEELQVSRQAVSKWEMGTAVPSIEKMKCLAKLYDVPLEYLLREDEQEPEKRGPAPEGDQKKTASWGMKFLVAWMTILTLGMVLLCTVVFLFISSGTEKKEEGCLINELERSEIEPEIFFDFEW